MSVLEPWVLARLVATAATTMLFVYGAIVGVRVLRFGHVAAATEGQLSLERHFELGANLVRLGAVAQLVSLVLSVLAADRLSGSIQGAMCGYGVVGQNPWGFPSIVVTVAVSLGAGVLLQLLALDRNVRALDLMRPLAVLSVALAPAALLDTVLVSAWLGNLDLSVIASCCSTTLGDARREGTVYWQGPRLLASWGAAGGAGAAIAMALTAMRHPRRTTVSLAGAITFLALPFALAAIVLEVAPHVYEVPDHLCPFCLFKRDAYFIGYPLLGSVFLAAIWGAGGAAGAALSSSAPTREAFPTFARSRMARQAFAWSIAVTLGLVPIAVYSLTSPGASLFR